MHRIFDLDLTKWVGNFIKKHNLSGEKGRVVVGLSGGPDSMLLSHVCEALVEQGHLQSVRHIHLDHGLRPSSGDQAFQLKEWCKEWRWDFSLKKITGPTPKSNIESWARTQRREILLSELKEGEVLFLAHHIDDSFEWYLRKTVNSSKGDFTFGIPLVNGKVRRPFHCLTREQIERFVRLFQIPYLEDESNHDIRFQRNALRKEVKAPLLKLFPKGLAHYVERSNQWANSQNSKLGSLERFSLGKNIVCLQKDGGEFRDFERDIILAIKGLSKNERGSLRQNLEKLYTALETHGRPGPLDFSGGVKIRMYGETLLFYNQRGAEDFKSYQKKWISRLEATDIPFVDVSTSLRNIQSLGGLPFCLFRELDWQIKGLRKDPMFQELIDAAGIRNLGLRPLRFLVRELQKKSDSRSQEFSVLPLLR